ncbi:MAG: TonB-dependent receptor plug domain-containing protein [Balneolaceae bacterium]|nr:TonB-dependent receptor plug domain-containing protein [Balneolaceae bacterium]
MRKIAVILILALVVGFLGCGTAGVTGKASQSHTVEEDMTTEYRNLADYLRRIPGVVVTGSGNNVQVQIRGTSSLTSETRPLYIVDGQNWGSSYYEVNRALNIHEVSNVRVLSGSDAAAYGVRGANGVIIVELKR